MKKIIFILLFASPSCVFAQFGLKAGLNFANVTNVSSINNSSSTGFNIGVFFGTSNKKVIGSKTELVFSRQGYNYKTQTNTGKVDLDYIMLPTYLCINISKYFQIQVGMQFGYLLNAKADSSSNPLSGTSYAGVMDFYNRFDYSLGGGVEVHPFKGLLVGARLNVSMNNLYKDPGSYSSGEQPSFVPDINVKNNLFQLYLGWAFGK